MPTQPRIRISVSNRRRRKSPSWRIKSTRRKVAPMVLLTRIGMQQKIACNGKPATAVEDVGGEAICGSASRQRPCSLAPVNLRPDLFPSERRLQTASGSDACRIRASTESRISRRSKLTCSRACDSRIGAQLAGRSCPRKRTALPDRVLDSHAVPMDVWPRHHRGE